MPVTPGSSAGKSAILGWVTALLAAGALTLGAVTFTGTVKLNDSVSAVFGTDNDASIQHNGTDLLITTVTGDAIVTPAGGDLILRQPGGVAGTDESQIQLNGGDLKIINMDGGDISLRLSNDAGLVIANGVIYPAAFGWDFGLSAVEWRAVYVGEDANSGFYIGNDQDIRMYYDEATDDLLKVTGKAWQFESDNVAIGSAAIATNAANGFLYVPGCAGTPTGTPTTFTGRVPIVVDTTNNKLYFYSNGAWRDAGP